MSVLSVQDLQVTYPTKGGDVPAVRGVTFDIAKGPPRARRGIGMRQVDDRRLDPPAALGRDQDRGRDRPRRPGHLKLTPGKLRAARWTGASIIFQGALHALNPVRRGR